MKSKAAVLWDINQDFETVELDLSEPRQGEVLIRYVAAGFCHSDDLLRAGDIMPRFPLVGGHEGAGVIEAVGPGVTRVSVGDHVITSFIPACLPVVLDRTAEPLRRRCHHSRRPDARRHLPLQRQRSRRGRLLHAGHLRGVLGHQ